MNKRKTITYLSNLTLRQIPTPPILHPRNLAAVG